MADDGVLGRGAVPGLCGRRNHEPATDAAGVVNAELIVALHDRVPRHQAVAGHYRS
jgi:hypothetical protein